MIKIELDLNEKYLLAVSGGVDSMALMNILYEQGYNFEIAHVNYHSRMESDSEESMVREYASKRGIVVNVLDAYFPKKGNFEDWARNVRYGFFAQICKEHNIKKCVVAHHLDDMIETYYLQLKRGYVSFYGLKDETEIHNVTIVRPLLNIGKKELESYNLEFNIPYSIDVTNYDKRYARNKIRHEVVFNMTDDEKKKLLKEISYKNKKLREIDIKVESMLNNDSLSIEKIISLDDETRDRLLFSWIKKITSLRISKSRINDIISKLSAKKGNSTIKLNEEFHLLKEYDCLKIVKIDMFNYEIVVDKPMIIDNQFIYFNFIDNPNIFYIKDDSYPLTIKIARGSDQIKIGKITKTVNRLWIDAKIPLSQRLYWPKIVNNKGEIIFVPRQSSDVTGLYIVKRQ